MHFFVKKFFTVAVSCYIYNMETKKQFSSISLLPILKAEKNNKGAEFTVVSKKTGKDYTFKISRSEFNGKYYTHVKVETGYQNFTHIGHYSNGYLWKKRQIVRTPTAIAIAWILQRVEHQQFDTLDKSIELLHTGRCVRCGKKLTDHESIKSGLGPICRDYEDINYVELFHKLYA